MEETGGLQLSSGVAFVHGSHEFRHETVKQAVTKAADLYEDFYWEMHTPSSGPKTMSTPDESATDAALGKLRQEEEALRDAIAEMAMKVIGDDMEPHWASTLRRNESAKSVILQYAAKEAARIHSNQ